MPTKEEIRLAKKIWDYHHLNHSLKKSDCIMVLGSHDTRVAERGAELFLQQLAPIILFSGGLGNLTKRLWCESEAEKFAGIAMKKGVPREKILIENHSTNTGENILFSYKVFQKNKIKVRKIILVQKPYMERRTYATFKKQWPGDKVDIRVTSPQISFEEYPIRDHISMEDLINIMLGDLQRIKIYPEKGFQIYQEIPDNIWEAYRKLVSRGYDKWLIKED